MPPEPIVKNIEDMSIHFDRTHERDRRTDGRTDTALRHRPRLCIASRCKNPLRKTVANYFAIFLQPSGRWPIIRCKEILQKVGSSKNLVYSQLTRVTDGQTNGFAISMAKRSLRISLAKSTYCQYQL